jgi:hypothetical protein
MLHAFAAVVRGLGQFASASLIAVLVAFQSGAVDFFRSIEQLRRTGGQLILGPGCLDVDVA